MNKEISFLLILLPESVPQTFVKSEMGNANRIREQLLRNFPTGMEI